MTKPTLVVGIGASAGGLKPIEDFFDNMPVDSGMSFVVVQHLSPDFKSLMDELLARHTKMPIHKVSDGVEIEPNSIYLIPPKKSMEMSKGRLLLTDKHAGTGLNLPIDIFFRSLAEDAGARSVAIVLSGTGSDGSRGIKDVHEAGGLVLVQALETVGFDGMPRAAISSGVVDLICAPDEMPERIIEYSQNRDRKAFQQTEFQDSNVSTDDRDPEEENSVNRIFRIFRQEHNLDFSLYKPATIHRRIERRMQLCGIAEVSDYVERVENDTAEFDILFRDLLVEVTHFFRDAEAFQRMRESVIPDLISRSESENEIRVWVCGCATGEEAYSIAILLAEAIGKTGRKQSFKVFATDVHRKSLEIASSGFYPLHTLENVPPDLQRYFVKSNGICNVTREIRQSVIFAANDLTRDPPFTRIDLITCRNVLIYLKPKVQKRVLSMFHFGLRVKGILFLGPSETVGDLAQEFDRVDRNWRIYSKVRDVRLPDSSRMPLTPVLGAVVHEPSTNFIGQNYNKRSQVWLSSAYEDLLAKHVPPSLLVDEFHELVHCFGSARKLLSPPEGKPCSDVLKMLEKDLSVAVSSALHRAKQEGIPVTYKGIRVRLAESDRRLYRITVEPYKKMDRSLYLISLEETEKVMEVEQVVEDFVSGESGDQRIGQLERELSYTRETLQATVEELESSNEELQATNEELIASNEELQSTNEELHSVNEELYTVNTEHKEKIEELTVLSSDMDNLLRNTEIGTIFLDRDFTIRMFTPSIKAGFNVLDHDIGRPISHIAYKLDNTNLLNDAAEVLETGQPIEMEVRGKDGTYLQRIKPYRVDNDIEGIVLTLTDISAIKEADIARSAMRSLSEVNQELPDFAYAVSHDLQAPLRHIGQYTQILEAALEAGKKDAAGKAARVIRNSSTSLRSMLEGLLSYSRINTLGKPKQKVKLLVPLQGAIRELQSAIDAINAEVVYPDDLPEVLVDTDQIKLLLFHLIDNGLKYRTERDPRVEISWEALGEHNVQVSVSDNGVGVEPHHIDSIFTIFNRSQMVEDVPGAGVGLAICRRIILRHGGRIWVERTVSEGVTFCFTLPIPSVSVLAAKNSNPPRQLSNQET
ncbi:MAG: chemotaxis protein CheB [Mariniblastus sp.]